MLTLGCLSTDLVAQQAPQQAESHLPLSVEVTLPAPQLTATAYAGFLSLIIRGDSAHNWHLVADAHFVMRQDSARSLADTLARRWVSALRAGPPVPRYQRVPMLWLEARIGDLTAVKRGADSLLAKPGISDEERAWILRNAVLGLLESRTDTIPGPEAIALARAYAKQLDVLPPDLVDDIRFTAHTGFMGWAWHRGDVAQAVADGWSAYAVLAHTPAYRMRANIVRDGGFTHQVFATLLAGQPNARHLIDSLTTILTDAVVLPPDVAAKDSTLVWEFEYTRGTLSNVLPVLALLGNPAPPLVATHWFNQAAPSAKPVASVAGATVATARERSLADGNIHIIEYGFYGCPSGPPAARHLQELLPTLPTGVDVQYYTSTTGSWGGSFVEPDVEAEHLRKFWVEHMKIRFPITVWAGAKVQTPDGGTLPQASPTIDAYRFSACPTMVIVDGHGIVRAYGVSTQVLEDIVRLVDAERTAERAASSMKPTTTAAGPTTSLAPSTPSVTP